MPGLGIKRILQGTPSGVLVEMEGTREERMFPENVLVEAGYMQPTQGLYADRASGPMGPDPYAPQAAPVEVAQQGVVEQAPAAPAAPAAPVQPAPGTSGSQSTSVSTSTPGYISRERAFGPAPAALDLEQQRADLDASNQRMQGHYDTQEQSLVDTGAAETRADEVKYGKWSVDPATGKRKLVEPGGTQKQSALTDQHLDELKQFDDVTREATEKYAADISARIAAVPQEDPSKIWGDNNAFQNAMGLMSSILGGALAVSTGSGRNLGLEALERDIDRNIAAQRTNIDNEWKKIAHDKDSLEQYQQWRSRERVHKAEEQALRWAQLGFAVEAEASTFKSEARKAERMGMAAELHVKSEAQTQEAIKANADLTAAETKSAFDRYRMLGDAAQQRASIRASNASARASDRANQPDTAAPTGPIPVFTLPSVNGQPGRQLYLDPRMTQGRTPAQVGELATDLSKGLAKDAVAIDAMTSHRELVQKVGSKYAGPGGVRHKWSDADVRIASDSLERTAAAIAYSMSGAQYAEAFREAVKKWTGGPAGWTGGDPIKSQTEYLGSLLAEMERDLGGRGVIQMDQKTVGEKGAAPAIAGPTESGAPVLAKGTPYAQPAAFSARSNFYSGDYSAPEDKNLVDGARELGKVVLTGNDPAATLQALNQLSALAKAPLGVAPLALAQVFGTAELGKGPGGKATVRYDGEGAARKSTASSARPVNNQVSLMRTAAVRAAARADSNGDSALAGEIMNAADALEQHMRGKPPAEPVDVEALDINVH